MSIKFNVYSVFDTKMAVFSIPFFMINDEVALRDFSNGVNDPQTKLYRNPEDYSLYRIGEYIESSGELISEKPVNLATAASYKVSVEDRFMNMVERKEIAGKMKDSLLHKDRFVEGKMNNKENINA